MSAVVTQLILKGVGIGLGAAMPIGPVNVEMSRRTLRGGFLAGAALGAGAVSVDVVYAVLTSLSVGRVLDRPAVTVPLAVVSVLVLGYLGVACLRAAWRAMPGRPASEPGGDLVTNRERPVPDPTVLDYGRQDVPPSPGRGYVTGLAMTVVNPMTLAFWLTTLPSIAGRIEPGQLLWVAGGVFAGTLGWVVAFSGTLAVLGRFRRDLWALFADAAGGVTLIAFAAAAFLRSIYPLL